MTGCLLCKRECEPPSALCKNHLMAKRNVESGYKQWLEAYGAITWKQYLQKIGRNSETGQWAKEVAGLLSKEAAE
jgi:hypothetical protein